MRAATTLLSFCEGKYNGILNVVPHESEKEAKVYCFDEIMREIADLSDCSKVIVESFEDEFGEFCLKITPINTIEEFNKEYCIMKTIFDDK